jgi:hypothetical protein
MYRCALTNVLLGARSSSSQNKSSFHPVPVVNGEFSSDSQGPYARPPHEKVCHALLDAPASDNSALSASCLDLSRNVCERSMKKGFPDRVCLFHVSVTQSSSFIKSLGAESGGGDRVGKFSALSSSSFQASNATFDVVERVCWKKDFYGEHKKGGESKDKQN